MFNTIIENLQKLTKVYFDIDDFKTKQSFVELKQKMMQKKTGLLNELQNDETS